MYAVVETGGKQYRVQPGDLLQVEKLEGEIGQSLNFDKVLLLAKQTGDEAPAAVWIGKPYVQGASVQAEVIGQGRGEKIVIVKMKRRKQYRRTQGHRQQLTQLLVTAVNNGAGEKLELDSAEKQKLLDRFVSFLKPKGPAFTAPILGSRKRLAQKAAALSKKPASAEKPAT
jgi:large subunit ribosomal protein L21